MGLSQENLDKRKGFFAGPSSDAAADPKFASAPHVSASSEVAALPVGSIYNFNGKWYRKTAAGNVLIPGPGGSGDFELELPPAPSASADTIFSPFVDPAQEAQAKAQLPLGLSGLRIPSL